MTPFVFATAARIEFGPGVSRGAGKAVVGIGGRALVVTGASPGRASWLFDALAAEGVSVETVRCPGEPAVEDARRAVAAAKAFGADVVVGVGGGAPIDLAKAVSGLARAGDPLDHLEVVGRGRPLTEPALPLVAIPTTAGTGAEVTSNAVLAAPEHRRKVSLRDARLLPRLALIDPDLLDGLPRSVALASGLDAIVQVIEPYLSRFANPMTDTLCRDAIPRGLNALPRLLDGDASARPDMALTSLFGGLALMNAKLGAVHGLAGVVGGRTGLAHGAICGRLAPGALSLTESSLPRGHPAAARCVEVRGWIAAALGGRREDGWVTLAGFVDDQLLPRLDLGGSEDEIAREAMASSSMKGAPVDLDPAALAGVLRDAGRPIP